MVSIPVRLHKAARRERIRFHQVYRPAGIDEPPEPEERAEPEPFRFTAARKEHPEPPAPPSPVSRVHNQPVVESAEAQVERTDILKGYEIEPDRYVTFRPREVAALRAPTSTELAINEFVQLAEIDPVFFDASYYVAPDRGGEKGYALLHRALAESGYAAIGSVAMHGREHSTVIRPGRRGLIAHTLFYANEVRADEEPAADDGLVNSKELDLAKLFVRALATHFDAAKLKDAYQERLQALIESRTETAVAARPGERAPVVDIMEALRKSLEAVRKPPARERAETKSPKTRQRRLR
jgi:DNA end-binding protein Ku